MLTLTGAGEPIGAVPNFLVDKVNTMAKKLSDLDWTPQQLHTFNYVLQEPVSVIYGPGGAGKTAAMVFNFEINDCTL